MFEFYITLTLYPERCPLHFILQVEPAKPTVSSAPGTSVTTGAAITSTTKPQDLSSSLSALFAKKDDSGVSREGSFGIGGLLGLRGGIPKLPSFRVSLNAYCCIFPFLLHLELGTNFEC